MVSGELFEVYGLFEKVLTNFKTLAAQSQYKISIAGNLALFKDEDEDSASGTGGGGIFGGYTTPGPKERATSAKKKANLGVMLGVYLPTIQHILGVTMFIRLFWVVGVAGIWHTMLLLFFCCACVCGGGGGIV